MNVNINEPITNLPLVKAMRELREHDNEDTINHMVDEMMRAHFLAPVEMNVEGEHKKDGSVKLSKDTRMQFFTLNTQEGERYLMAFSDWEEAHRWKAEIEQTVVLTFDDYAALILQEDSDLAGFVINPFNENIPFQKEVVRSLKVQKEKRKQPTQHAMKAGEQIRLGEPNVYPKEMMDAIYSYLQRDERVEAAYLRLMQRDDNLSWLVMVDAKEDYEPIFAEIANAARPFIEELMLDMLPIDALGEHTLDGVEPFYAIDGYEKPLIMLPSVAIIEELFAMKNGGCVLGCFVQQGAFTAGDYVDVIDATGKCMFTCKIDGMEQEIGHINHVQAEEGKTVRVAIMTKEHAKDEFIVGYRLRKTNI